MKNTVIVCATIGFIAWLLLREQPESFSTSGWGTKQKLSGAFDSLSGTGKQAVGKMTGDDSMRAEGLVDEAIGAVKRGVGKAVDAAKDVARDVNKTASDS